MKYFKGSCAQPNFANCVPSKIIFPNIFPGKTTKHILFAYSPLNSKSYYVKY